MAVRPSHNADLVINARWIVPVEPAGTVLEDHAVAVTAGRIIGILPRSEVEGRFRAETTIDRPEHVLLPGLVNTHTHAAMSLLRGYADDLPLHDWLEGHIWPAERRWVGPEFVRDGTLLAMLEMVHAGVTCFNDMYYFPDVVAGLAVEHHLRVTVGMIVIEQPTPWARTTEEYFSKGLAVHDQYRNHPLVQTAYAPHAPYTVSDPTLRRLRSLADELDVPVHMHVHETRAEIENSLRACGKRPLRRLEELGLLSCSFMAVHMAELDAEEIELLAERHTTVVHCPSSNLKLASGFTPVARLLAAGVNVALGTDGAASNNSLDLFGEMRTAALLAKAVAGDASALPAAQALALATINGARALGRDDEIGSLLPGKYADIICMDLRNPATQPTHHVISQLVYSASSSQVTDAWVAGRQVLAQGRATLMDEHQILERAEAWRQRLAKP
jgi:5-methylthioadenosine/S-adenosylhomocysteine deaminase